MGVILEDCSDADHTVAISWWNWRPTLELVDELIEVDDEMFERMQHNGCGGRLTAEQARELSRKLRDEVLPELSDDERIRLSGSVTDEPDDGRFHRRDLSKNYSAHQDWLETFAAFCASCDGFEVL